jgi:hypothetical protein
MMWFVAGISLFATWPNIRRVRACFGLWFCTNATWSAYDFAHGLPAQGCLMAAYALLAVVGFVSWRGKDA